MLEQMLELEHQLQFQSFDFNDAKRISDILLAKASEANKEICLKIFAYGKTVIQLSMDSMTADHENWLNRKGNTVMHFQHSTYYINIKNQGNANLLHDKYGLDLTKYCIVPGGFPIRLKPGGVIGYIAVSGMEAKEDHRFVEEALREVIE